MRCLLWHGWRMRRSDICLYLGPADRAELRALISNRNTPRKLVWRAEIVLATADGHGTFEIMRRAHTSKPTVWRWQQRYLAEGVEGLKRDKTRPSRVPPLPMETRLKVITKTVQETPPNATHWSRSLMAEAMGISPSSVGRIWAEAGLKPHITKGFKVSNDPLFEEKVTEIVGLYLDPPDRAVVLCVDEKSQIQALDRTQPGLPLKKGRAATMTHDYKRHGTTTLFAALNSLPRIRFGVLDGTVIGQNMHRHRHQEFIRLLNRIERTVPADKASHVILDNYAAHKKDKVRDWLARHPRWTFHFTPTSCSWLNAVEGFFAKLTRRRLKHGVFHSLVDLQAAINRFVREYNAGNPQPFVWKASPDDIIAARNREFQTLESIH
jgi:transposase